MNCTKFDNAILVDMYQIQYYFANNILSFVANKTLDTLRFHYIIIYKNIASSVALGHR